MYIFYLLDLEKPLEFKLAQYKKKEKKQLLNEHGLFNIGEKNIFREKISIEDSGKISHYIKNFTLVYNKVIKKNEKILQIPYSHIIAQRIEYIISKFLTFIIIKCNKHTDFFFETKEDLNHFELKKNLFTFLSLIK